MSENLRNAQPLGRVKNQQFPDKLFSIITDSYRELVITTFDELVKIFHIGCFEGNSALKHRIKHHSKTPRVSEESFIAFICYDLWSNVCWCSTLLLDELMLLDDLGHSEITQFDSFLIVEQDIIQLDVSVQHASTVTMSQTIDDLFEDEFGLFLTEASLPLDIVQ